VIMGVTSQAPHDNLDDSNGGKEVAIVKRMDYTVATWKNSPRTYVDVVTD